MLAPILKALAQLARNEDGPTAVEYAIMLAMIITLCVSVVNALGNVTSQKFENASSRIR